MEWQRNQRKSDPARTMWGRARTRAKKGAQPFTITVEDVRAAWPADGRCPVLGIALQTQFNGSAADGSPSLDRINPAWGYEPGNIAVISHAANRAKGSMTADDLERVVAWMRRQGLN